MVGWTGTGVVPISSTTGGFLKVAVSGAGFSTYAGAAGTAADAYPGAPTLAVTGGAQRWDILIETNEAVISWLASDGVTWLGDIPLAKGFYSWLFTSTGIRIKNRVGGSNSVYSITAFS
jgi:hypothetical protein